MSVKLPYDIKWEEEARIQQAAREWRAWIQVECTKVEDGPRELCIALPAFMPYKEHPKDPAALVSEFYPKRLAAGSNWWLCEVTWSTDVDVSGDPLGMPAVITMDTEMREVPAIFDCFGNPLLNTAGDLMTDPPATRKLVDQTISISKNVPIKLPDWVQTHPGAVNLDDVQIRGLNWPAGTLWMARRAIGAEQNVPGATETISTLRGTPYTTIDFELWYRADGWVEYYPNRGFMQLVPKPGLKFAKGAEIEGGKRTLQQMRAQQRKLPAYDRMRCVVGPLGDLPSEPQFLDLNGQMIINPTFDDVILLAYDGYTKLPFNQLPLK